MNLDFTWALRQHGVQSMALLALCLLVLPGTAQTLPLAASPNGCGTGWNTYLVPDVIPVLGCRFEGACNKHDQCYGKCIPGAPDAGNPECRYLQCRSGGALAGSSQCQTPVFRALASASVQRRQTCDRSFYGDLIKDNPGNATCRAFAYLYREAVTLFGGSSFLGAGSESQVAELPLQLPDDVEQAITDLLSKGNARQLNDVIRRMESGRNAPDLKRALRFDAQLGLINPTN